MKTSFDQARNTKLSSIKEVDIRTNLIMNMVIQVVTERECMNKHIFTYYESVSITPNRTLEVSPFQVDV